jgi:DNA-binding YbaB/EbfC family protein
MNRDMMAQLGQMQDKLAKAQQELEERVATGTAGGGAVKIEVSGGMKVQSLKIDPEVVDPGDVGMLEDLVTAAVNEALQQVQEFQMGQLGGLAGGLGLGGLGDLGLPGLGAPGAPGGAPTPPMNRAARRQKR